jgi:hypothetical protein
MVTPFQPQGSVPPRTYIGFVWLLGLALCLLWLSQGLTSEAPASGMYDLLMSTNPPQVQARQRLSICTNEAYQRSQRAVVSLLGDTPSQVLELGKSVRMWWSPEQADLILLSSRPVAPLLGWTLCLVDAMQGPHQPIIAKLKAWALSEYEAVLLLDSDTLVLRDPSALFGHFYQQMRRANTTLAAVLTPPCQPLTPAIQTQVLLLIPSMLQYLRLRKLTLFMGGPARLGRVLRQCFPSPLPLPSPYNANVRLSSCSPGWEDTAVIESLAYGRVLDWGGLLASWAARLWGAGRGLVRGFF